MQARGKRPQGQVRGREGRGHLQTGLCEGMLWMMRDTYIGKNGYGVWVRVRKGHEERAYLYGVRGDMQDAERQSHERLHT